MSDAERRCFNAHTQCRNSDKRQIKPIADEFDGFAPDGSDEEDEDFIVDGSSGQASNSGESGAYASSDDDSNSASAEAGNLLVVDQKSAVTVKNEAEPNCSSAASSQIGPICSLCLNFRPSVINDELIECDRCGVIVHENCYIIDSSEDLVSNHSSSSTEPWFCEPCLYGLKEPPYCELCPNRYGAFKKSDIGGGWVHLLCALCIPGITFGDVTCLTAVSWQEIDYKLFGKKPCVACIDPKTARTGITVQCDAALCKNYLHVTCAQRCGLLIDSRENSFSQNSKKSANDAEMVDSHYVMCKQHCDEKIAGIKKGVCAIYYKREDVRMVGYRSRQLHEREERKRLRMLAKHKSSLKRLEGITIAWPEHDNRRPRSMRTSVRFFEQFSIKADSAGIDSDAFLDNLTKIRGDQISYLTPGFSHEYIGYFKAREDAVIPSESKKLASLEQLLERLSSEQSELEKELEQTTSNGGVQSEADKLHHWYMTLTALGVRKICLPDCNDVPNKKVSRKRSRRSISDDARSECTSNACNGQTSSAETLGKYHSEPVDDALLTIHVCDVCKKSKNQHLLIMCDTCHKHNHLDCLDPPLSKMPKKHVNFGWECSKCYPASDSIEQSEDVLLNGSVDSPRKLRDRSSNQILRKEAEKAQTAAYRAALRGYRLPWKSKRVNGLSSQLIEETIMSVVATAAEYRSELNESGKEQDSLTIDKNRNTISPIHTVQRGDTKQQPPQKKRKSSFVQSKSAKLSVNGIIAQNDP